MIEWSTARDNGSAIERRIASLPAGIRSAINRSRVAQGLPPIHPEAARRAIFATPEPTPRVAAAPALTTRVLAVAAYGIAPAHCTGRDCPEMILRGAFGDALELNAGIGWTLRDGHDGPIVAARGPRLRAIDSTIGLVLEWLPDPARLADDEIVRRIEAGTTATSVAFTSSRRRTVLMGGREVELVTRGTLCHVALLPHGDRAAYPGSLAMVFRARPADDRELARQIEAVAAAARWRAHGPG